MNYKRDGKGKFVKGYSDKRKHCPICGKKLSYNLTAKMCGHCAAKERSKKYPMPPRPDRTGSIAWNKGLKGFLAGDKHHNWKGGISKNKSYSNWYSKQRYYWKKSHGSHTFEEWETLKAQYNWTCPCCHKLEPKIKLTEDHIIPISKGGSHNIENIQPLCLSCNCKKHTLIIKY